MYFTVHSGGAWLAGRGCKWLLGDVVMPQLVLYEHGGAVCSELE